MNDLYLATEKGLVFISTAQSSHSNPYSTSICKPRVRSYPVAFEAKAELRESLAFTSMMQYSIEVGWRANWILHSPTMPKWRTTFMEDCLNIWNSALDSVWAGATTTESPVHPSSIHYLMAFFNNPLQPLGNPPKLHKTSTKSFLGK